MYNKIKGIGCDLITPFHKDGNIDFQSLENIVENLIKGSNITLEHGFLDKYKIGSFEGYKITEGIEGCGQYLYYLSISLNQTLVIHRNFYAETFQGDKTELNKISGFITSEQEESIFQNILLSVKGIK